MKVFAIKCGKRYLQHFEANEKYKKAVRAIQSTLHLPSEFVPVWGDKPNWMDCRTVGGYLRDLSFYMADEGPRIKRLVIEVADE